MLQPVPRQRPTVTAGADRGVLGAVATPAEATLGRMTRLHGLPLRTFLFAATLCLTALPVLGQRLPGGVTPTHYDLWFAPDLEKETFRGRETIEVTLAGPATTITLHAAEIAFGEVTVKDAAGSQLARVTLDEKTETATLTVPRAVSQGPGHHPDRLYRHPQRQAPRLLSEPRQRPQVRRESDGSDRRAARVSVVRRTGLQGDLRHLADDRRGGPCHLERPPGLRHTGAGAGQAHGDLRADAEDVHLSRGAAGGRFRLPRRQRGRHSDSRLLHARQAGPHGVCAHGRRAAGGVLQQVLRHPLPVRKARHHRRAGLRRRRDGECRRDHVPRAHAAGRRGDRLGRRPHRGGAAWSPTSSRTSGSAIS